MKKLITLKSEVSARIIRITLVATLGVATLSFNQTERKVYICESKNATAYHLDKECSGLQRCKSTITQVSEETAKKKGLHFCGLEK